MMQQLRILKRNKDCNLVYACLLAFIKFIFLPKNEVSIFNLLLCWVCVLPISMSNFDNSLRFSISNRIIFSIYVLNDLNPSCRKKIPLNSEKFCEWKNFLCRTETYYHITMKEFEVLQNVLNSSQGPKEITLFRIKK